MLGGQTNFSSLVTWTCFRRNFSGFLIKKFAVSKEKLFGVEKIADDFLGFAEEIFLG